MPAVNTESRTAICCRVEIIWVISATKNPCSIKLYSSHCICSVSWAAETLSYWDNQGGRSCGESCAACSVSSQTIDADPCRAVKDLLVRA